MQQLFGIRGPRIPHYTYTLLKNVFHKFKKKASVEGNNISLISTGMYNVLSDKTLNDNRLPLHGMPLANILLQKINTSTLNT